MTDEFFANDSISRRQWLRLAAVAAVGTPIGAAVAQGRCMRRFGTPGCDTTAIAPVFDKTGWKTTALDSITMIVGDYRQEAAFYTALMGWTPRSDDGTSAVIDMGNRGPMLLKQGPAGTRAVVESFGFVIEPWNAKNVEAELRRRGLSPVADNDGAGYESFVINDPDGFPLRLSNGKRKRPASAPKLAVPLPFESTGWKTVWLDHISFSVTNYKQTTSFYTSLLGWSTTYDEEVRTNV